ncbi:uncharacterized protein [Diadema setosum]|uniref:uncharacterized protein n=1 Tax=Diadema setosum TaxID=31175 RepID=UPI003B3A0599
MIRSLSPGDRRKWPDLISQLVFLYNCTPHCVTGLSPYRLMFGREPYTPLDQLLSNVDTQWSEDFVADQAESMRRANEYARRRIEQAQRTEKERHDALPMSAPLEIGRRVLLKRCAFDGRHKLADRYYRIPYVVTARNEAKDVYTVRPLMGGPEKNVNRKLLVPDPRGQELPELLDDAGDECPTLPEQQDEGNNDHQGEPDSEDEERPPYWIFIDGHHRAETETGDVTSSSLRRSERKTKGMHSNPFHTPVSAVKKPP